MERRQPARRGAAARPPSRLARTGGPGASDLQWLVQGRNRSTALSPRRRRLRRAARRIRRGLALVLALGVLGIMVLGGLLLITPSVGDASSRLRALDRAHGVPYPGPVVPERFAAALAGGRETVLSRYLARALYTTGRSGPMASAEVDLLAVKLDMTYPARKIVQMYADAAYFGHGWYGLKAASCGYFGAPPQRLSPAQASMLVGVATASASLPRPHTPRRAPACQPRARRRR
jgi:penicillin-binding protein 1A